MSSENSKLDIESNIEQAIERDYPLISKTGKRYKMIAPNIREYVSGTRYDETKGRGGIIQSPKSVMITPETAPAMQALGIETRLLAKQEAVRRGALLKLADKRKISLEELSKASEVDAEAIGYSLMERIQDKYSANGVAAAKLYMEQQDMLPKRQVEGVPQQPGTVTLTVTTTVQELRDHMQAKYKDDVVDGEVKDAG